MSWRECPVNAESFTLVPIRLKWKDRNFRFSHFGEQTMRRVILSLIVSSLIVQPAFAQPKGKTDPKAKTKAAASPAPASAKKASGKADKAAGSTDKAAAKTEKVAAKEKEGDKKSQAQAPKGTEVVNLDGKTFAGKLTQDGGGSADPAELVFKGGKLTASSLDKQGFKSGDYAANVTKKGHTHFKATLVHEQKKARMVLNGRIDGKKIEAKAVHFESGKRVGSFTYLGEAKS